MTAVRTLIITRRALGELRNEKLSGSSGSDVPIALTEITLFSTILQRAQHNDATMAAARNDATMQQCSVQQCNDATCGIQRATYSTPATTDGSRPQWEPVQSAIGSPTGYADRAGSITACKRLAA